MPNAGITAKNRILRTREVRGRSSAGSIAIEEFSKMLRKNDRYVRKIYGTPRALIVDSKTGRVREATNEELKALGEDYAEALTRSFAKRLQNAPEP